MNQELREKLATLTGEADIAIRLAKRRLAEAKARGDIDGAIIEAFNLGLETQRRGDLPLMVAAWAIRQAPKRSANARSKLTAADKREARRRFDLMQRQSDDPYKTEIQRVLAKEFGVDRRTIQRAIAGTKTKRDGWAVLRKTIFGKRRNTTTRDT